MKKSSTPKRRRWPWLVLLIVVLAGLACFADRNIEQRDHPGLSTFLRQWSGNYPNSFALEPVVLEMNVEAPTTLEPREGNAVRQGAAERQPTKVH
jgi:hypothetical protein